MSRVWELALSMAYLQEAMTYTKAHTEHVPSTLAKLVKVGGLSEKTDAFKRKIPVLLRHGDFLNRKLELAD